MSKERRVSKWMGSLNRSRRSTAVALGGAAAAVSILVVMAPAAAGAKLPVTLVAPYKGGAQSYSGSNSNGCTTSKGVPWTLNLTSGIVRKSSIGRAVPCANPLPGSTSYSYQSEYSSDDVGIVIKAPAGVSHVTVNVTAGFYTALKASDGGKPACKGGQSYDYTSLYAEWNYKKSSSGSYFANYNDSYWDRQTSQSVTTWRNYTSIGTGVAAIPSPWHFNNTTYWSWYHSFGGYFDCYASANAYLSAYSYLVDQTNGSYIPQTGRTVGYYGQIASMGVEVYNYSSWGCYNSTNWDGPSASWSNTTQYCYSTSNNATLISFIGSGLPPYWTAMGHNNTAVAANTTTITGYWYWNYTFAALHKYVMYFYLDFNGYSSDNWPGKGFGSYLLNMASLGYGFKLNGITLS